MGYKMSASVAAAMLTSMQFALEMSSIHGGRVGAQVPFLSDTHDGVQTPGGSLMLSGNSLINTSPIVFDVTVVEGSPKTVSVLKLFEYGAEENSIYIDLTGGPYTFTTSGTFTIPAGGITISLATQV